MRDHLVKPFGRLFSQTYMATQQSRSNLARVIQIAQLRVGRKEKSERGKQR
jgi:hypothetical protein